ncbi:MAG: class I SAM-dependent methyltransferase [Bacteroidetes bacterium]|nr:class I SAM-dependent methyltransferase [Bacteroidota bacterium]MBS1539225.1 class I SAM-dependent methyltransferase [Bacteroidota bacterium]
MSKFFQAKSFLAHWLDAVDDHSIHSPFFFDFYNRAIKGQVEEVPFAAIENTRERLLANQSILTVQDLGDTSPHFKNEQRTIAKIAQTSLNPPAQCQLYYRIASLLEAKKIIELGTSMGICSLYLASVKDSRVITFEGNHDIANIAQTNFEYFNQGNIKLMEGNIDRTLPEFLQTPGKIDFVLMDANHRYEPTLRYFNWLTRRISDKGVVIIDDIYRSQQMAKAWRELRKHDLVYGSIDLFSCGILFFDLNLNKQHFTCQY